MHLPLYNFTHFMQMLLEDDGGTWRKPKIHHKSMADDIAAYSRSMEVFIGV